MGQAEKWSGLDLPRIYKQNIKGIWRVSQFREARLFYFQKVFPETSDSIAPQGYQVEGRKTISLRKGGRDDETQSENQCFKAAADWRNRILQKCHGQGKVHEASVW